MDIVTLLVYYIYCLSMDHIHCTSLRQQVFPLLTDGRNDGSISSESDSSRLRNSLSSTMGVMVEVSSKTELMEISLALLREVESRGALDRERSAELGERREREGEREWLLIYTTIT